MPIDPRVVGERIAGIREASGRSLSDVAVSAQIAKSYLAKLERGEVENPGLATLHAVADALDITLAQLVRPAPTKAEKLAAPTEAFSIATLPPSLREFVKKQKEAKDPIPVETIAALARLEFKGKRPERADDWYFIYQALVRSVRSE